MADTQLDDGIQNLQVFCELLDETQAAFTSDLAALEVVHGELQRLEGDAQAHGEALVNRLVDAVTDVEAALQGAVEAADRLGTAATEAAQGALATAAEHAQAHRQEVETRVGEAGSALDAHLHDLGDAGFAPFTATLEDLAQRVTDAAVREEQSLGHDLQEMLRVLAEQTDEREHETIAALDAVTEELTHGEETLTVAVTDLTGNLDHLGGAVDVACAAANDALASVYEAWLGELTGEGEALAEGTATLVQELDRQIHEDLAPTLEQAATAAVGEALQPLAAAAEQLAPVAADGEQAASEAAVLVPDLVVARHIVAEIDELLDAMKE